ncbi:MAG: (d)CMP kinase [Bacteroidales bacterium]|nr:(d)CMP kinase [Bacteroidales bacterium]
MTKEKIIIAVDGYSSTGKSSFAKAIASRLGYTYVDSGALYRTITLFALEQGWIQDRQIDESALKAALPAVEIGFDRAGGNRVYLNGVDVSAKIRSLEVSEWVSPLSALHFVREHVDKMLKDWGKEKGIVMDGRDIGTVVFPQAELKIFMTARPEVRAQRRHRELLRKGDKSTYKDVLENIRKRDFLDQNRPNAPLRQAPDALLLDNSDITPQQQMQWLEHIIAERWA